MARRLTETMQVQLVLAQAPGIAADNLLAEWGGVPYAQLSVLLVHLRFLSFIHQTHHWVAKGDSFYGDHQLFERLYNEIVPEIDALAEKSIGLGCDRNVDLPLQVSQLQKMIQSYGASSTIPQPSELARRSMLAEVQFLKAIDAMICSLSDVGQMSAPGTARMTNGLENMLQGIADVHEGHVYLLKQRCQGGV